MKTEDYTAIISTATAPHEVYNSINNVTDWWTEDLEGGSHQLGDAFTVRFGDVHVSTQKITALVPDKKIEWLVTYSKLNFAKDPAEWTHTRICFDISQQKGKTELLFTHVGLVPEIECYTNCTKGWDYYIKGSLLKLLTEGKGTPGTKMPVKK